MCLACSLLFPPQLVGVWSRVPVSGVGRAVRRLPLPALALPPSRWPPVGGVAIHPRAPSVCALARAWLIQCVCDQCAKRGCNTEPGSLPGLGIYKDACTCAHAQTRVDTDARTHTGARTRKQGRALKACRCIWLWLCLCRCMCLCLCVCRVYTVYGIMSNRSRRTSHV